MDLLIFVFNLSKPNFRKSKTFKSMNKCIVLTNFRVLSKKKYGFAYFCIKFELDELAKI